MSKPTWIDLLRPRYSHIYYFLLILICFYPFFQKFLGDKISAHISEIVIYGLLALAIRSMLFSKSEVFRFRFTYLDIILSLLIISFTISYIINDVPLRNMIMSFKYRFLFFIFLISSFYFNYDFNQNSKFIKTMNYIFLFQLVAIAFQFTLFSLQGKATDPDNVFGTFDNANVIGYIFFYPTFYYAYIAMHKKSLRSVGFVVVYSIVFIVTFARFTILAFPVLFLLFNAGKVLNFKMIMKIGVAIVVLLGIMYVAFSMVDQYLPGDDPLYMFSYEYWSESYVKHEFDVRGGSSRLLWFPVTHDVIERFSNMPIFGVGPGMYGSAIAMLTMPPPTLYIFNLFNQIEMGLDPNIDPGLITIWGEMGYVGLSLFLLLFCISCLYYLNLFRRANGPKVKALCLTAAAGSIYMILGLYVMHFIEDKTTMFFYAIYCILADLEFRKERSNIFRAKKFLQENLKESN